MSDDPQRATGMPTAYDPRSVRYRSFARARVEAGFDPRDFLEECLAAVDEREGEVRAFVSLDADAARAAADASAARWRDGRPLSPVDGLPFAVKDCYDVAGEVTRVNSGLFADAAPAQFDAAHVHALRSGGAIPIGKTVTTELTMAMPGPTWNPWDLRRTPGGSSTGSAAAVAAGMVPAATGSQVRGSGIRPASICGIPGLKPTYGALNRHGGVDPSPSLNHLALLGATFGDIWDVAQRVAATVGGDPGHRTLPRAPLPEARRPLRLARQYTSGWEKTDAVSQAAFEELLRELTDTGVEIVEPGPQHPDLARYEASTASVHDFFFDLFWEAGWLLLPAFAEHPERFSAAMRQRMGSISSVTVDRYERALDKRDELRAQHRAMRGRIDGFITLSHIGPGQFGQPDTGSPWYSDASSAVGAPTANVPLLAVDGVPLGVQVMGFEHEDADLVAMSRWLMGEERDRDEGAVRGATRERSEDGV